MSALDELKNKEEKTDLDAVVIVSAYYERQTTVFSGRPTTVYSEKAAAELLALRERVEKMAVILQWIYDDGEGGTYRPDIVAALVEHNKSQ